MKWLPAFLLLFLAPIAQAEVFRCQQADGTTVFAYVPCRAPTPEVSQEAPEATIAHDQPTPPSSRSLLLRIKELESELDRLRESRELEIANAPFSTSEPTALSALKNDIRASYQLNIDHDLAELLRLRGQWHKLSASTSGHNFSGTAD